MLPQSTHARSRRGDAHRLLARLFAGLVAALLALGAAPLPAQEVSPPQAGPKTEAPASEFGKLFDAVVAETARSFWDKERLAEVGWQKRAAEVRQSVVDAPSLDEAARRINALLAELKTSHTALLTPDDVDYYVFGSVFGRSLSFAGIGIFSVRIDGRDFVDLVLEGSPADRAGLKVGDEIVSVAGAPYHPVRSFRGKVGEEVAIALRRAAGGPAETVDVVVADIRPLQAFHDATLASARVIDRDGRRIGYVRVWASLNADALAGALRRFGDTTSKSMRPSPLGIDGLVIDMRGKIGGIGTTAARYLELIDPRGPQLRMRTQRAAPRRADSLRGRTTVLIDHHTRSTAELFVHAYKRERQGPLIGTRTAGAVSSGGLYSMPGDNLLYLAIFSLEVDGEILEGAGVAPDIEVARPIPYSNGADPVLDAAVAYFLARKAQPRDPEPPPSAGGN